jgi:hypothetical protein
MIRGILLGEKNKIWEKSTTHLKGFPDNWQLEW